MAYVQPTLFDVGVNESGKPIIYVFGTDCYIYLAELKETSADMVWLKSKNPAPSAFDGNKTMALYNNTIYLVINNVVYVTGDFGVTWNTYPINVPPVGNENEFGGSICVTDDYILLGCNGYGAARSIDGGKNWDRILTDFMQPLVITTSEKFLALGGFEPSGPLRPELVISLRNGTEWKWSRFKSEGSFNGRFLNRTIVDIILDDSTSMIYLIHDFGISFGKISVNGGEINIEWNEPFQNIQDYFASLYCTAHMIFGSVFLFMMQPSPDETSGSTYLVYAIDRTDISPKINERSKINNPYGTSSSVEFLVSPSLRRINNNHYSVYSSGSSLSLSYNNGPWQSIGFNV